MSGVDLEAIHRALAAQIRAYVSRDTNVDPFPNPLNMPPSITVHSDPSTYLAYFGTFGPGGEADLMLRLKVEVMAADLESVCIKMCDYLGVGTGNPSSIVDAIRSDKTLGGLVDDTFPQSAEWDTNTDPTVAWIPVHIVVHKIGAQP